MRMPSFLRSPPPRVALDIGPRRVAAVAMSGSRPGALRLTAWAVEPLAAGAVVPALTAPNIARPAEVVQAIGRLWDQLGQRPKRVALVIPDGAAKVSFVRFQTVPARAADLDEMIRFQIRKAAPFPVEESQLSYDRGALTADGQEFVVVQARGDIVAEYEQACDSVGARAGAVDLATFNVANAVLGADTAPSGDWLLVHATPDGTTLTIHRGPHLVFFRHRGGEGDGQLGDLVHQTAMYYQDRLGGRGFGRVVVAGGAQAEGKYTVAQTVEGRLGVRIEPVDPSQAVRLSGREAWTPELVDALTPAIGLAIAQHADRERRS